LSSFLRGADVSDKATVLLIHRIVFAMLSIFALALVFGVPLALSARGSLLYPWLCFILAAFVASYVADPSPPAPEWSYPETWLTLVAIGLVAWLVRLFLARRVGQHVAP